MHTCAFNARCGSAVVLTCVWVALAEVSWEAASAACRLAWISSRNERAPEANAAPSTPSPSTGDSGVCTAAVVGGCVAHTPPVTMSQNDCLCVCVSSAWMRVADESSSVRFVTPAQFPLTQL